MPRTSLIGELITLSTTIASTMELPVWSDIQQCETRLLQLVDQYSFRCANGVRKSRGDGHHKLQTAGGQHRMYSMVGHLLNSTLEKTKNTLREVDQGRGMILTCWKLEMVDLLMMKK
jgi:hypothetical protein